MERHSVACKYDDISVLELYYSKHRVQNVSYGFIRQNWGEMCSITNAFLDIKSLKMSLSPF